MVLWPGASDILTDPLLSVSLQAAMVVRGKGLWWVVQQHVHTCGVGIIAVFEASSFGYLDWQLPFR